MFSKFKKALVAAGIAAAVAAPVSASAAEIELALVLDASGSISNSQWDLQTDAYASALASVIPTDGTIAISVVRFAQTASVVRNMTTIDSVDALDDLTDFFTNLQRGNGNTTCISCGIFEAESTFSGNALRSVIDVSTDGGWNTGVNPAGPEGVTGTSAWAVEIGKASVVNAIGIGVDASFNYGPGSFHLLAADFAAFKGTLITKLLRETGQVPLPGALALIGIGLLGLGVARRRMA